MILFPYYYNVPDKYRRLQVRKNWLTFEEYVNNVHLDPITREIY